MKKIYGLFAALIISATLLAQARPQEKKEIRNDLIKERDKRHEVAHDVLRGEPEKARADHRAALRYHEAAAREVEQEHQRTMHGRHHVVVRKHYRHHHRRHTTVEIRH
ncbi:MAG: hypothetical protein NVSMB7_12400 [Chitinophagaceae bacterium]